MQFEFRPFRSLRQLRSASRSDRPNHSSHTTRPGSASRLRRATVAAVSLTAALGLALAVAATATPATASAASGLRYHRGYTVQGSWLCYGWSSGAYHCTQHWYRSHGHLISTNTRWVPNYGTTTRTTRTASAPHTSPVTQHQSSGGSTGSSTGGSSSGSVQSMIQSVFGAYGGQALRVAACESGYNPTALNRSSGASGVFQFLRSTWATTSYAGYSPFNAWANINAAHQVFVRDGYSWREWTCQP